MRERREPRVVIVGAGVAGITALHVFRERGFADVTVLEKGSDVGRVWYWNRYPGLTCDVPSQLYQFRFAPKLDWSHVWADGPQIQRYHRRVVDDLGLAGHIRTDTEVAAARWDEGTATWELTLAARGDGDDDGDDDETITADVVVFATGVLHHPTSPTSPDWRSSVAGSSTPHAGPTGSTRPVAASLSSAPARPASRWCPPSSVKRDRSRTTPARPSGSCGPRCGCDSSSSSARYCDGSPPPTARCTPRCSGDPASSPTSPPDRRGGGAPEWPGLHDRSVRPLLPALPVRLGPD